MYGEFNQDSENNLTTIASIHERTVPHIDDAMSGMDAFEYGLYLDTMCEDKLDEWVQQSETPGFDDPQEDACYQCGEHTDVCSCSSDDDH
jgi:hypothetical protein|tara:strand:+ start:793 stop:1062 length:270 start_codon:yes stop_codon:yes gene_type:complete